MFRAEIEATNHCNIRCLHCPSRIHSRRRLRLLGGFTIYEKEDRVDLLVNRLLRIEKSLQAEKAALQAEIAAVRRSKTWRIYNALNRLRARLT